MRIKRCPNAGLPARLAALVLCCALFGSAGAQQDVAPPPPPPAPAATAETGTTPAGGEGKPESEIKVDTSRTPDRFIPTEEIPEDFSVSFPVDI